MKINSMQSLPTQTYSASGSQKKPNAPAAATHTNTTTGQGAPVAKPAYTPPAPTPSAAGLDTFAAFQAAKSAIATRSEEATASATAAAPKPLMTPEMTRTMGGLNTALALVQATSQQLMSWDFMSKEPAEPLWAQEGARSYQAVQDAPKASALWETLAEA